MDLENFSVRDASPYPEIIDATDCKQTVAVLKDLATSHEGELMAVLTYIFQDVVAEKSSKEISKVLEEIAVVEMTHLDMLMRAITDFGGVPKYEDARGRFFNTANVDYSLRLKEMLNNNIKGESEAIANYTQAIKLVKNESLKKLFARIILDEECHLKIFKFLKDTVKFLAC